MSFWRHMVTGADNKTVDHARVLTIGIALIWALGALTFLMLAVLDYLQTRTFSPKDFAYAFGALITSGGGVVTLSGAGIALKASTEPKPQGEQP
jgi:hypothetical protein